MNAKNLKNVHPLLKQKPIRTPCLDGLALPSLSRIARVSDTVLDVIAEMEDCDLHPGIGETLVANTWPELASFMHAFYAGEGPPLSECLGASHAQELDERLYRDLRHLARNAVWLERIVRVNPLVTLGSAARGFLLTWGRGTRGLHTLPLDEPPMPVAADTPDPFFELQSGAVLDRRSGLFWTDWEDLPRLTYDQAVRFISDQALDGGGWRLPKPEELGTLVGTAALGSTLQEWFWTADSDGSASYAWSGKLTGGLQNRARTWRLGVLGVKKLTAEQLRARIVSGGPAPVKETP